MASNDRRESPVNAPLACGTVPETLVPVDAGHFAARFQMLLMQRVEERLARLWPTPRCEGPEDWDASKLLGLQRLREIGHAIDLTVGTSSADAEVLVMLDVERRRAHIVPTSAAHFGSLRCRILASPVAAWIVDIDPIMSAPGRRVAL